MACTRFSALMLLTVALSPGCGDDIPSISTDTEADLPTSTSAGDETAAVDESGSEATTDEPAPEFCAGATMVRYDPLAGALDALPDDFYTVDDDSTPSGLHLDLRLGENVVLTGAAESFGTVFEQATTIDGWGTTADLYFQFDGQIDGGSIPEPFNVSPSATDPVVLVDMDAEPPALVPIDQTVMAEDIGDATSTLVVRPLQPLRPLGHYAFAITSAVTDADGDCVAPSPTMVDVLSGDAGDAGLSRLAPRVAEATAALQELGVVDEVESLSGLVVFTTQHTVDDSAEVAAAIAQTAPQYVEVEACVDTDPVGDYRICEGSYVADNFTTSDGALAPTLQPQGSYTIPITVYLPTGGTAPYPTFIYGHGLGGARDQGELLAEFAATEGIAVVTLPAPSHGQHPDTTDFNDIFDFFGLSLDLSDPLNALMLRDNFRQASYDKLQLLAMLLAGVDVDGDGTDDVDPDSVHYLGVSLGGIMGPEFLAFAPEIKTATLIVPGARVTSIVSDGEDFASVIQIFAGMATDGEIARFFPLVQTVIDRGDPGAYAGHVAGRRLEGYDSATPQVLMQMVLGDTTVPNVSNAFYARALGVPHLGEVLYDVGAEEQSLPVSGNFGDVTAGLFQFDVIDVDGGPDTQPASHGNVARSLLAQTQILHFVRTWMDDGTAEIVDPYVELGIE